MEPTWLYRQPSHIIERFSSLLKLIKTVLNLSPCSICVRLCNIFVLLKNELLERNGIPLQILEMGIDLFPFYIVQ